MLVKLNISETGGNFCRNRLGIRVTINTQWRNWSLVTTWTRLTRNSVRLACLEWLPVSWIRFLFSPGATKYTCCLCPVEIKFLGVLLSLYGKINRQKSIKLFSRCIPWSLRCLCWGTRMIRACPAILLYCCSYVSVRLRRYSVIQYLKKCIGGQTYSLR